MWFKQAQFFSFSSPVQWDESALEKQLRSYEFSACLPHLFSSKGWVSPCGEDEDASLLHGIPDAIMLCCQFEEKILPATVIQHALQEKIKQMTIGEGKKKISVKEKQDLKIAITQSLLPRAFTKFSRVYAYIDKKNHWLVINTTNKNKTEQLMSLFQRSVEEKLVPLPHKKIAPILTRWLIKDKCPRDFFIEKTCLLQDPQQHHRLIRCQEQDLFSESILSLLQDRCEVKQLALSWRTQVHFILTDDFTFTRLSFGDEIIAAAKEENAETAEMQFQADFILMVGIITSVMLQLLKTLGDRDGV